MKLTSVTISGFRCFGVAAQTVQLRDLTCLVGPNASGKTALMMAFVRLFGESPSQRQLLAEDFHLGTGERLRDQTQRKLLVECRIDFAELEDEDDAENDALPESFNQMIVDAPGNPPYCRLRLEGIWTDNGTPKGDVEQTLSWILTDSDDPKVIEDGNRRAVQSSDRRRIRVIYVPAARDPDKQIAITTNTSFGRLLSGLRMDGIEADLRDGLNALHEHLATLPGIATINSKMQTTWESMYAGRIARDVAFRALEGEPSELLSLLSAHFDPGEDGRTILCSDLSDGLRSLFSLSLSLGLFRVEQTILEHGTENGFKEELAQTVPLLTVFAVEEPENHLSPHYLGRVVRELTTVAADANAQVLLSSHSPGILGRVGTDDVRYCLGHEHSQNTTVKQLPLPDVESDESFKYVREAVKGHPELYFSRLLIFVEGPSEEIVLKRLFEASGNPLDSHFISVVPLGGRHVNHFWRLAKGLSIPHLTLLDLDREKEGAGWVRIKYVRDELVKHYGADAPEVKYQDEKAIVHRLADVSFEDIKQFQDSNEELMSGWLTYFEDLHHVFFSSPLDIDFAMLEAFPNSYQSQADQGPRLPKVGTEARAKAVLDRVKLVLAADPPNAPDTTGSTYSVKQRDLFPWYKYLFLDGSKPVTHMRAMISIDDAALTKGIPSFLRRLVDKATSLVTESDSEEKP